MKMRPTAPPQASPMTTQTASVSKDTGLADPINLFLPILYMTQVATLNHHARAGACTVRAVPSGQLSGPTRNHDARVQSRPRNQTMHLVISAAVDRSLRKRCDPAPAQPGETGPAEPTRSWAVMPERGECLWYAPRPALTPGVRDLATSARPRKHSAVSIHVSLFFGMVIDGLCHVDRLGQWRARASVPSIDEYI